VICNLNVHRPKFKNRVTPSFDSLSGISILTKQDFNSGQSESRISNLANQNLGFQFWQIRIQDFNSGQSESRISILANPFLVCSVSSVTSNLIMTHCDLKSTQKAMNTYRGENCMEMVPYIVFLVWSGLRG